MKMSHKEIVEHMIDYIENAEKDLQASKLTNETKTAKNDIINGILDELERVTADENKNN